MKTLTRCVFVLMAGVMCFGCWPTSPSESLTGDWVARGIGHSLSFGMSLQQTGDAITGVACGNDAVVLFRNAPVQGEYPHVRFVVTREAASPCCAHMVGWTFSGKIDGTRDIVGASGFGSDLRFERSERVACAP